ncbi:peptidylprolyl isomerase [Pseudanabaenaceae cyanobacterium LEGE 13415]|nr:peptidylprolyl isomerase [Pseudanabaenaceae cyanobacterium LEGE 13415]
MTITSAEIEAEIARFRHDKQLIAPTEWAIWLDEQLTTRQDFEANVQLRLLAKKLAHALFDSEVDRLFTENPAAFEQVLLYRIAVPYERLAQELFYRIEESEISFYEAARLYDVDEQRRLHCGYEGKRFRRDFNPEVARLIFDGNVSEGSIVGPIQSSDSTYDLLLVEQFTPAELSSVVQAELLTQKFQDWLDRQIRASLD